MVTVSRMKRMNSQSLSVVIAFGFWYVAYLSIAVGSALIISWERTSQIVRK